MKKPIFHNLKSKNVVLKEGNKVIYVKLKNIYSKDIELGIKKSELRLNDRDYKVGDILYLQEINDKDEFTGKIIMVYITHILDDNTYLQKDYVCLSIEYIKSIQ